MAEVAKGIIDIQINAGNSAQQLKILQSQLNAFTMSLNSGARDQAQFAARAAKDLQFAINRTQYFTAETIKLSTAASTLDKTLSKGKVSLGQFFSAKFNKNSAIAAETMALAAERAKRMQTQFIATSAAAKGFQNALAVRPLAQLSSEIAVASQRTQLLSTMFKQGTTQLINFGKNVQWAGRQLMVGFTVPLTIFGNTASKVFADLEQAAIRFKRVYGDLFTTEQETARALKSVEDLAKSYTKYNIAVKDTINLAADLAAAGYQGAKLNEAIAQTNRLATLGNIDQQKSMNTIISLQNAFEISSKELAGTINYLNSVENQTVVSLDDITEAIPRVAPVIKGLGGDVKDLTVFLAAMEEGGVSAEQGANALKSGLASLINPTKAATQTLAGFGINLQQIVSTNKGDLMGTVKGLGEALATLSDFQKQQAIEAIFGKYQFARLGALFTNIVKEGSQANEVLQLANRSAVELAYTANKELSAVENAVSNKFKAAIEDLKVSIAPIGEVFLKISIPVLNFLEKIIDKFNGLSDGKKQFIAIATVLTGVVIPAGTMFFGLLMNLVGTLLKLGQGFGAFAKGFITGGPLGAIKALSQSSKYLSLTEMDAAMAAQQLAVASDAVNAALMEQVAVAGAAENAMNGLNRAYMDAITTQNLMAQNPGFATAGRAGQIARKYSSGVISVPGSGNRDTVPAMLTPGEAVIPAAMAKKYAPLINGMISNSIPGYSEGLFAPTDPKSQKILNEARNVANNIDGVSEVLEDALVGLEESISPTALSSILKNNPILQLLSSSTEAKGRSTGSSGLVKMHVGGGGIPVSDVNEIRNILTPGQFEKILQANNVRLLDNLVFGGPAAANRGQLTGLEFSSFVSNNPKEFMGQISAQSGVDAGHPDFIRFANNVAQQMAAAGSTAIGESEFDNIIQIAISEEIDNIGKNTAIEVKNAFEEARKISTVSYAIQNSSGESVVHRANIPTSGRGVDLSVGGTSVQTTSQKPYRQVPISSGGHTINDNFIKEVVSERLKDRIDLIEKDVVDGVKASTEQASPSKKAEEAGKNIGRGAIIGIESQNDDAKIAGEKLASNIIIRDRRASQQSGAISGNPNTTPSVPLGLSLPPNISSSPEMIQNQLTGKRKFLNTLATPFARMINGKEASKLMAAGATDEQILAAQQNAKEKEIKSSNKAALATSNLSNKLFAASMGANAIGMGMMAAGGSIGEFGKKLLTVSSTVTALSSLLPMLTNPIGVLTLAIVGVIAAVKMQKDAQEEAAKSIRDAAQKQADAMTGSALTVAEFGKAVGMQSIEEKAQQRRLGGEQASVFYQALTGGDMSATLSAYREARASGGNVANLVAQDVQRLALQYDFTKEDVSSYISAVAEALDSYTLNTDVRAKLVEMLYSDGKTKVDLLENPEIKIDVVAQMKENFAKTPGGAALAIANQGVIKQIQDSSKLVLDQVQTIDKLKGRLEDLDILQGIDGKRVDSLSYLATAFEQSKAYNEASGTEKFKEYFSATFASSYISGLRDRAQGNVSMSSTSVNFLTQEEAAKKLAEIESIVDQYNQKLKNGLQNTNSIFQSMSDQKAALELLKQEYESTNMTLQEYQDAQNQINDNQRALTQSLKDQANAAREAGTYDDWSKSTMSLIGIQVDASNATDALKERFKELQESITELSKQAGNEDIEVNFATSFKNFDGSLEDFMIQWETLQGMFDNKELASEVSLWMSENSIDLEYVDQISVALSSLEDANVEIFVDGQVTPEALAALNTVYQMAQLAAGKITANNRNLIEGRGPITSDPETWSFLKDLPSKLPGGKDGNDGKDQTDTSGGSGKNWLDYLMNRFEITDKRLAAQIQQYQDVIDLQERQNELDQRNIDLNQRGLDQLSKQEDEINKAYEDRISVLNDVANANDRLKQQEQSRISLASALASGDISGAASQMADITASNAAYRIEDARAALEVQKEQDIKNLKIDINGELLNREQIQERIDSIEETIYQRNLKIRDAQDSIYNLELQRTANAKEREKVETKIYMLEQQKAILELQKTKVLKGLKPDQRSALLDFERSYNAMIDYFNSNFGGNLQKVQEKMYGGMVKKFAFGGIVPGRGSRDKVPAMLTPGEFVIRKSVARANMPMLEALNNGMLSGPSYTVPQSDFGVRESSIQQNTGIVYNDTYSVNVNVSGTNASPDDIANVVLNKLSKVRSGSVRGIRY